MVKQPNVGRQTLLTSIEKIETDDSFNRVSKPDEISETTHDSKVLDFLSGLEEQKKTLCTMENFATATHLVTTITYVDQVELAEYNTAKRKEMEDAENPNRKPTLVQPVTLKV